MCVCIEGAAFALKFTVCGATNMLEKAIMQLTGNPVLTENPLTHVRELEKSEEGKKWLL